MLLGETCMVNGMQAKVNARFPIEVLLFLLLLKNLIQRMLKSAELRSLEADLDQRLGLFRCGNSCHAFSDKEGDHILTSCKLFSSD